MRLIITGGAGFIGSNLSRLALVARHEVVILDDLLTGYRKNIDGIDVTFVESSIVDPAAVSEAAAGVDSVVHLGAPGSIPRSILQPVTTHVANATGTLTLLEEARAAGVKHVACASSSSVRFSHQGRAGADWRLVLPV